MAGIKLDLTDARDGRRHSAIEVFGFRGGTTIHVPPDWTVPGEWPRSWADLIDERRLHRHLVPTKTLVISGFAAVMSGMK